MQVQFEVLPAKAMLLAAVTCLCLATSPQASASPTALNCQPVQSALGIPNQLQSAIFVDKLNHTVILPMYKGVTDDDKGDSSDDRIWFVLTDTSDLHEAVRLGINWSPKLANALGTAAVQRAALSGRQLSGTSVVHFAGTVDFSGQRVVLPGPDFFPVLPGTHAGPMGSKAYSPLFTFGNGIVYNGAHIANSTGMHPKALSLDKSQRAVTIRMTEGRYLDRQVLYVSTDASDTVVGALENATFAPNLAAAPQRGSDDCANSASEAIIPIVNGERGIDNLQRQGLQSAVAGEGDPLNIIREEPECSQTGVAANCSALQYSPLWDATPVAWTQAAINAGQRLRIGSHQTVEQLFSQGLLVNANPNGPSQLDPEIYGLRALGVVINCPPIFVAP
jgi:hypothetical protein